MKFQYAFQKIVDLKSTEKTQAEWMLSSAIGHLQAEEKSLNELYEMRDQMYHAQQEAASRCVPISEIRNIQVYAEHLEECIERKRDDIRLAHVNVTKKKKVLSDKMLDEKVWLKARDKSQEKFRHESLLREQNELDEMATVRFAINARLG
ncbi:flagellar export protein FliJ [Bacillus sp. FJAT-18019]|uniref:Flagellar FliJ protein n=1 Tax=Paenibacillus solani TaxID=1705565 RepID=A0A0M1P696_9BACL|nr:flagellar export protein FliJ [Paenibacillus solani]KOP67637.1 flagellar export protein FliJ [Bacillus sp. FJAT-18019]KOR90008.1 flagellar export protein FliJ [Paenibacillus solani]